MFDKRISSQWHCPSLPSVAHQCPALPSIASGAPALSDDVCLSSAQLSAPMNGLLEGLPPPVYQSVPECTRMYKSLPKCTKVYQSVLECTRVYQNVLECTRMNQSLPKCTRVYQNVPKFTKVYRPVLLLLLPSWPSCPHPLTAIFSPEKLMSDFLAK